MTATIFLVRHAAHDHVGRTLSGRLPDLALSAEGRAQAAGLARRLSGQAFDLVQSSPVLRARETAEILSGGAEVEIVPALEEIDFGEWTGLDFAALDDDPRWRRWNAERGAAQVPGGERMRDAQARIVTHVDAVAEARPGAAVLMVTHCDLIRAAVAHYLGLPLDNLLRFDIEPASVTKLAVGSWGGRVQTLNEVVE